MTRLQAKWRSFKYYLGDRSLILAVWRWVIWGIRCLLRLPATVYLDDLGIRLYLVPRWRGCWKAIYVFRERFFNIAGPEWRFVEDTLTRGGVFVDAGAFQGWHTLVASRVVGPTGLVLAFEPSPEARRVLERNVALNGQSNVRIFDAALSDAEGTAILYRGPDDGVASSLSPVAGGRGQDAVVIRRLDDVLQELRIDRVDLLKVDVEGAEARVLHGAAGTIGRWSPVVLFEVYPTVARNAGVSERAAWDILNGQGYAFFTLSGTGLAALEQFPHLRDGALLNVVAVPSTHERR